MCFRFNKKYVLVVGSSPQGIDFNRAKNQRMLNELRNVLGVSESDIRYDYLDLTLGTEFPMDVHVGRKYCLVWFAGCNVFHNVFYQCLLHRKNHSCTNTSHLRSPLSFVQYLKHLLSKDGILLFTESPMYRHVVARLSPTHSLTIPIADFSRHFEEFRTEEDIMFTKQFLEHWEGEFVETVLGNHIVYTEKNN